MKGKWFLLLGLIAAALVAGNALPASASAAECTTCEEGEEEPPIEEFEQTLTIAINGIGSVRRGTTGLCESSSPAGHTCELEFPEGEALTLSASPGAGLTFTGWTGDCSGSGNCELTMDEERSVTATFTDTTPPAAPTITSPTANQVFERTAEEPVEVAFGNSGDTSTVAYLCSLDQPFGGAPCASPWHTGNLAAGQHTVFVWAKDAANNVSSPASRSFEVVIAPPAGEEGGEEEGGSGDEGGGTPPGDSGGSGSSTGAGSTSTPTGATPTASPIPLSPKIAAVLVKKWKLQGNTTLFRKLALKGLPRGAKVVATCAGKGCPFKRKKPKVVAGVADLTKLFGGHGLAANVLIELKVSAPGMTGQTIDLKTRAGKAPKATTR